MKRIQTFESFINENIRPDQIEKVSKDLAYSMPNHTEPDSKGKFSAEQVQKAFKYIPDLKYVKDKNDIQTIIDKVLAIVNESGINEEAVKSSLDKKFIEHIVSVLQNNGINARMNMNDGTLIITRDDDEYVRFEYFY
jgi:hypothetical protein